jgi:hypothetical protein
MMMNYARVMLALLKTLSDPLTLILKLVSLVSSKLSCDTPGVEVVPSPTVAIPTVILGDPVRPYALVLDDAVEANPATDTYPAEFA